MSCLLALDPTTGWVVMDVAAGPLLIRRNGRIRSVEPSDIRTIVNANPGDVTEVTGEMWGNAFPMNDPVIRHWMTELAYGRSIPLSVYTNECGALVPCPAQERKIGFLRAVRQVIGTLVEGGADREGRTWIQFRYHDESVHSFYHGDALVPWYGIKGFHYAFFLQADRIHSLIHDRTDLDATERGLRAGGEITLPSSGRYVEISDGLMDLLRRLAGPGRVFLACRYDSESREVRLCL